MRNKKEIEELKEKIKKLEDYNKYLERKKIGTQIIKENAKNWGFLLPSFVRDIYVIYADEQHQKEEKLLISEDLHIELAKKIEIMYEDDFTIFINTHDFIIEVSKNTKKINKYYPSDLKKLKMIVKEFENEAKNKQVSKTRTKPKVNTNRWFGTLFYL